MGQVRARIPCNAPQRDQHRQPAGDAGTAADGPPDPEGVCAGAAPLAGRWQGGAAAVVAGAAPPAAAPRAGRAVGGPPHDVGGALPLPGATAPQAGACLGEPALAPGLALAGRGRLWAGPDGANPLRAVASEPWRRRM